MPASPNNPYMLTAGELSIAQNMTIAGAGARTTEVNQQTAAADARVFDVLPGVTATISGLDMIFGKTTRSRRTANLGGNVLNRGTLTLSEDFIELGQTTGGIGGGIANVNGTLAVTHSLIQDNSSFGGGEAGGLYNDASTSARTTVDNSTIVGNTATSGAGGILSACTRCTVSSVAITNSTITGNDGGSASPNAGGLLAGANSTIMALNTIVAANTVSSQATRSNCSGTGTITSLGHNLESDSDCGFHPAATSRTPIRNSSPAVSRRRR